MTNYTIPQLLKITHNRNGFVDMPILSHIEDVLYVGMTPQYWPGGLSNFRTVFSVDSGRGRQYSWNTAWPEYFFHKAIHDSELDATWVTDLEQMADSINRLVRQGDPVLVHCEMGVNRSNLLTAMYLIRHRKMTPKAAIGLLRSRRDPLVLMNRSFCEFLLEYPTIQAPVRKVTEKPPAQRSK